MLTQHQFLQMIFSLVAISVLFGASAALCFRDDFIRLRNLVKKRYQKFKQRKVR